MAIGSKTIQKNLTVDKEKISKADSSSHGSELLIQQMPHNLKAEKGLIGGILLNNRAHEQVSEFLKPQHFAYERHGKIFEAISKLIDHGQIADGITLQRFFEQDQSLIDIGGSSYLAELTGAAASVINTAEYGRIVYDLHLKRELINLGQDIVKDAFGGDVENTGTKQIEIAEQNLYELATEGNYEGGFQDFKTALILATNAASAAHQRQGGLAGVGTQFTDLDKLLGGLHNSDLLILAGRPAMGKNFFRKLRKKI